jgi:uncharacterized protein YodC (DUF2158 family)
MTFQAGDVVALKSGGQYMTVAAAADETVECIWIAEEGELFRETLPAAVLKAADTSDDEDEDNNEDEDNEDEDNEQEDDVEAEEPRKIA